MAHTDGHEGDLVTLLFDFSVLECLLLIVNIVLHISTMYEVVQMSFQLDVTQHFLYKQSIMWPFGLKSAPSVTHDMAIFPSIWAFLYFSSGAGDTGTGWRTTCVIHNLTSLSVSFLRYSQILIENCEFLVPHLYVNGPLMFYDNVWYQKT